jgi:hypothetical protein
MLRETRPETYEEVLALDRSSGRLGQNDPDLYVAMILWSMQKQGLTLDDVLDNPAYLPDADAYTGFLAWHRLHPAFS